VGHRTQARSVPVGHAPPLMTLGRVAAVPVLVIAAGGLGSRDEIHKGPQVRAGDLHDVIAFLAQRPGDRPVPVRRDVHDEDPQPEILYLGHDLGQVLLRADDDRVADRVIPGQRGQVTVHLGFHALAPARPHPAQPQLDPGQVGQRVVLGTAAALDRRLVPVAAQHRQAGTVPGQPGEQLDQARVIPGDRVPVPGSVDGHGAVSEHVARINEHGATIHAIPSFPSTRDVTSARPPE